MRTVQLNVSTGYQIDEEKYRFSVEQARQMLLTKKQRKFTLAERDDTTAHLTQHSIRCPHCNHKTYAYAREVNKDFGYHFWTGEKVDKELVYDWTSQQISMFEEKRNPLLLNQVIHLSDELTCPACKNTIYPSDKTRRVEVTRHRQKITVRAEILDVGELFTLPYLYGATVRVASSLFEVACFNFRNGHSYVRLETEDGACIAIRDLTYEKSAWSSGAVYNVLSKNKTVRRLVKSMFDAQWQESIPYCTAEFGVNEMRMLTAFVGYGKRFYSSIPFAKDSLGVDESFKRQARKMHRANALIPLLEASELPNMRSLKRIFFENQGLFFYLEECERLWKIFGDPNHFVTLLQDGDVYQFLSDLHMRPLIFNFLEDYAKTKGLKRLLKMICLHWYSLCKYAVNYSSMSECMQAREQQKWLNGEKVSTIGSFPAFAIPMGSPNERIRNCSIDEFEFAWLKTSADYQEAGKALNNCLSEWSPRKHPVVCVKKGGKIIAALEIRHNFVFQAFTANNNSLERIPGLLQAYYKWHAKNKLAQTYTPLPDGMDEDFYVPDYEDELPF